MCIYNVCIYVCVYVSWKDEAVGDGRVSLIFFIVIYNILWVYILYICICIVCRGGSPVLPWWGGSRRPCQPGAVEGSPGPLHSTHTYIHILLYNRMLYVQVLGRITYIWGILYIHKVIFLAGPVEKRSPTHGTCTTPHMPPPTSFVPFRTFFFLTARSAEGVNCTVLNVLLKCLGMFYRNHSDFILRRVPFMACAWRSLVHCLSGVALRPAGDTQSSFSF
jgi:hypothetical protein